MSVYRDGPLASDAAETAREGKRRLLGRVAVASPCEESWDAMIGDDRSRFCTRCAKDVHDVSAMTLAEAEEFVARAFESGACARLYRRADGTIITADCPEGVALKRRRAGVAAAVAGTAVLALAACNATASTGVVSDQAAMKVNAPIGANESLETHAVTDPSSRLIYK